MKDAATFDRTTCCVVGAGPAGAVLALMLARNGVPVTLLEMHQDFEREFRGDTLHPSVMEIMDELGLAEPLQNLPHTKLRQFGFQTPTQSLTIADFSRLKTKFPYITLIPQVQYLEFVIEQARRYPHFTLLMDANVRDLIRENGRIAGVRYTRRDGVTHELRATLTIAADGRFSRLRKLAALTPVARSPPMDVLWLRMPKRPGDTLAFGGRIGGGHILAILERPDHYQLGYVIAKGSPNRSWRICDEIGGRAQLVQFSPENFSRPANLRHIAHLLAVSGCIAGGGRAAVAAVEIELAVQLVATRLTEQAILARAHRTADRYRTRRRRHRCRPGPE